MEAHSVLYSLYVHTLLEFVRVLYFIKKTTWLNIKTQFETVYCKQNTVELRKQIIEAYDNDAVVGNALQSLKKVFYHQEFENNILLEVLTIECSVFRKFSGASGKNMLHFGACLSAGVLLHINPTY